MRTFTGTTNVAWPTPIWFQSLSPQDSPAEGGYAFLNTYSFTYDGVGLWNYTVRISVETSIPFVSATYTFSWIYGGASLSTFSPLLLPNCDVWFDATNAASIVETGSSFAWTNLGASGGVAFTSAAIVPHTGVHTLNGKNVVYFDAYTVLDWVGAFPTKEKTVFVVTKVLSELSTAPTGFISYINVFSSYGLQVFTLWTSADGYGYILIGAGVDVFCGGWSPTNPYNVPTRFVMRNDLSTTANLVVVNNVSLPLSWNLPSDYNTSTLAYSIGSSGYGTAFDLAEMIIYDRALSDAEVAQVNAYLTAKWGV